MEMQSRSRFFILLVFSALLFLSISQDGGAGVDAVRSTSGNEELGLWKGRELVETSMDYQEPGANTNPRGGLVPPPATP